MNKRLLCVSLEPWTDRLIPAGMYHAERFYSPKFKRDTFKYTDVFNRTDVEFHPGNVVQDTVACTVLGQYPDKLHGDRAVLNSGTTFDRFMSMLAGAREIIVVIRESY